MFEQLLARLARVFDKAGIQYMVIGGQAVMIHGRLRVTEDIDVTLGLDSAEAGRVLEIARAAGLRPLVEDPCQFALRTSVLPMQAIEGGVRVDFVFSFTPYERQAIERSVAQEEDGYPVRFATAEDLIIHKLFAGRPQDIQDVRGILARKQGKIDKQYSRQWIGQFSQIEGKAHLKKQLEDLLAEVAGSGSESVG